MATFLDSYLSKLEKAKNNIESDVLSLLMERESEIRAMIKQRWLLGRRPDGSLIGFYRDVNYAIFKQTINPSAKGDVDLILSGDLVNNIKTVLGKNKIEILSSDYKFEEISLKYGLENFNITEEEENELLDGIMAEVVTNIFKEIWG